MMRENLAENLQADYTFPNYGRLQNSLSLDFVAISENVALARSLVAALIANCRESGWDMTPSALEEIKVAVYSWLSGTACREQSGTYAALAVSKGAGGARQRRGRGHCRCAKGHGAGIYHRRGAFGAGLCLYEFLYGRCSGEITA